MGRYPTGIFVNSNNSIYIPNQETGQIHIWENENSINPSKNISGNLSEPSSLFVTENRDIYVDNGKKGSVDKWIAENNTWISVMPVESQCFDLFIDILDNLYCSMRDKNRVEKKWSNDTTTTTVAGTGVEGSLSDMLYHPWGIFVDINFDLYVADSGNDRIQLFGLNQPNGITIAGQESSDVTIELYGPTGIVLDGDQYIFIVDSANHRLIGSDKNGFRCIFGCSDLSSYPRTMSFDSYGNIYVIDQRNHRIQKIIKNNMCDGTFFCIYSLNL